MNDKKESYPMTVVDIKIPFWRAVNVLLELMLASIPAVILFWCIMFGLWVVGMTLLFGFMSSAMS